MTGEEKGSKKSGTAASLGNLKKKPLCVGDAKKRGKSLC
jgi:hypothetical protein